MNPDSKNAVGRMTEMIMPAPEQTKHWQIRIGSYRGQEEWPGVYAHGRSPEPFRRS